MMTDTLSDRVSLGEAAYRQIRADIISCRLAPGQRLTERGLTRETGLSVSAVREALTRLDQDGLVRTLPRKGYLVTPLTVKSVDDLFALWRLIGPELARLGIQRATAPQLQRLGALITASAGPGAPATPPADEARRRIQLTLAAFDLLADSTSNDYLISVYHRIAGDLARVGTLLLESELAGRISFTDDATRTDRLLSGDADGAAADVLHFIEHARSHVLEILSRWPSVISSEIRPLRRSENQVLLSERPVVAHSREPASPAHPASSSRSAVS